MNIVVLIKRVPDTASVLKISPDSKSIEMNDLKYILNPYDEYAVEEAVKTKGSLDGEVVVVSAGAQDSTETIRVALAMGADRAVFVKDPALDSASSKGISLALAAAVKTLSPDLVFAGKQAVDDDASQVAERVAEILGIPHVSVVSRVEISADKAVVDREVEGGHYTTEVPLPALFTTPKGLNTPRYPSIPNIMKAKKKEIKEVDLAGLGLSAEGIASGCAVQKMSEPKLEKQGKILEGDNSQRAKELVKALHEQEKVI